jgi:hypothetical protein
VLTIHGHKLHLNEHRERLGLQVELLARGGRDHACALGVDVPQHALDHARLDAVGQQLVGQAAQHRHERHLHAAGLRPTRTHWHALRTHNKTCRG